MLPNEPPSVSATPRGSALPGSDPFRTVVWVRGEHDVATTAHLSGVIAEAARLDNADIVVDLSGVTFMDASTIGALAAAHIGLRARSRSLSVRAPSPVALRLLDLCELAFLIDGHSTLPPVAAALGSWVAVPASDPRSASAQRSITQQAPSQKAARAGPVRQPRVPS